MALSVFTYGSLMFAPVWQRVVRASYRSAPATLAGHARYAIAGETYPGMIAEPGATVHGILYFDVTPADMAALDAFEGDHYRRVGVDLALADGQTLAAETYLYLPVQNLSDSPWNPDAFQLQHFLGTYCRDKLGE